MKFDAERRSLVVWWVIAVSIAPLTLVLHGCGKPEDVKAKTLSKQEAAETITPAERPFYDAAKPFAEAIAARDYNKAYEFLSTHAKARMSPNQFVAPDDDATAARNERAVAQNVSAEKFGQMLVPTEKAYGKPVKVLNLHVFSTDPKALSGKGQGLEKLDAMFAIGMMPASIPTDIRKASVRSKLKVELSAEQLADAAKAEQTTPEKLKAEFQPYVTLKIVLVQEAGVLKVGYFEFLPPGIMD
jgi:hypothetical protein